MVSRSYCTAVASVRELLRALDDWNMKRCIAPRTSPSRMSPPPFIPSPTAERHQTSVVAFSERLTTMQDRLHAGIPSGWPQGSNTLLTQVAPQSEKKEWEQSPQNPRPKSPAPSQSSRSDTRLRSPGWLRGQESSLRQRLDRAGTASPTSSSRSASPHNSPLARCMKLAASAHSLPHERPRGALSHWGSAPKNVAPAPQTTQAYAGSISTEALGMQSSQRSRGTFSTRFSVPGASRASYASDALDRLLDLSSPADY